MEIQQIKEKFKEMRDALIDIDNTINKLEDTINVYLNSLRASFSKLIKNDIDNAVFDVK